MNSFITIPTPILKNIASGHKNIPTMYYHSFKPIQKLFWARLAAITQMLKGLSGNVLDFGGGGGIYLPTLAQVFQKVICLDLVVDEAQSIKEMYSLKNVDIIQSDALKIKLPDNYFDVIIAADVLEHFQELTPPIRTIYEWLRLGGRLFISGPSENWLYRFGRKFFGIHKPPDHYHSVIEIEHELSKYFRIRRKMFLPWYSDISVVESFAVFTIIEAEKI